MPNKFSQISLFDIYEDVNTSFIEKKSNLVSLLEKHIDFSSLISYEFHRAFYSNIGRKHKYHLESFIKFDKIPDGSYFTRFKQKYCYYLAERKSIDGLGCLYKVEGIGEDGLGYRYISGPKKATANKGKFYSGIPLKRVEELKTGKIMKYLPVSNFYDFAGAFGNCRLEGSADFKGGKKPEILLEMILKYFTNEGDLVLDSFLGSGTTAAVAHKMRRKYIGIELGEHCYSLCKARLDGVINGTDKNGITTSANWQGGGGYKFYELAPTLIVKDKYSNPVFSDKYNPTMLAAAVAKINGFIYAPSSDTYWKQGYSQDNSFIYVTTQYLDSKALDSIADDIGQFANLLICAPAFDNGLSKRYDNINIRKIPQSVLKKCEFGVDNYNLNIVNPPEIDEDEWEDEDE